MPEPSPEAVKALFQQAADLDPVRAQRVPGRAVCRRPRPAYRRRGTPRFRRQGPDRARLLAQPGRRRPRHACRFGGGWAAAFIGRYRVLRRHGEGGMGTVYEAEQDNPRRTVALKVIRPGLVSPELVKRFTPRSANPGPAPAFRYRPGL